MESTDTTIQDSTFLSKPGSTPPLSDRAKPEHTYTPAITTIPSAQSSNYTYSTSLLIANSGVHVHIAHCTRLFIEILSIKNPSSYLSNQCGVWVQVHRTLIQPTDFSNSSQWTPRQRPFTNESPTTKHSSRHSSGSTAVCLVGTHT